MTSITSSNSGRQELCNNFILRRSIPFLSPKPTKEWQETSDYEDYENRSTLPDEAKNYYVNKPKIFQTQQNKTVIYFGDTSKRDNKNNLSNKDKLSSSIVKVLCDKTSSDSNNNGDGDDNDSKNDNKSEEVSDIVISVRPSREDVLKIEENESKIDDYWALPGDTTGFRADWSFVQQWRLRG